MIDAAALDSPRPPVGVRARLELPVTKENVMTEVADADAYVGSIRPEEVRAGKKLQWVQIMSAGAEGVLFKSGGNDLRDSNIVLTNNQIVQGPEIADHAFAMLLMLSRGLNKFYKNQQQELWQPRPYGARSACRMCIAICESGTLPYRHADEEVSRPLDGR